MEFVRERYAASFDAEVQPSPDAFVVGHAKGAPPGDARSIAACAGLTFASGKPFFSERYLDSPIESYIHRSIGVSPERSRIVEVGPLASRLDGSGKTIIQTTPMIAWCLGMQYIMCTATRPLLKLFDGLGIPFLPLQAASSERLTSAERERWGSYYETQPVVGVVPLNQIASLFSAATGRFTFADPVITLQDSHTRRRASSVLETEA